MRPFRTLAAVAALTLTLAACSGDPGTTQTPTPEASPAVGNEGTAGEPAGAGETSPAATGGEGAGDPGEVVAIATTTQLGDIANQVAQCAGGSVETLMPPGADPHDYGVSSAEIAEMTRVPLVIINGLGLEAGMNTAIHNAEADGANILEIAPLVDPIPFGGHGDDDAHDDHDHEGDDHDHAHDHSGGDPHIWLDAARMATAAELIGQELATTTGNTDYAACGTELATELNHLHEEIRETLAPIPAENRKLVTDHQAYGYFATAYDFEQLGVVIPGGSTDAEPSSDELAALVHTIQEAGVPAIFSNNAGATRLIEAVAAEVGDIALVELFEGSLGPAGSGADTYQGMMRENTRLIVEALG